jgi:prolyl-tRNA synthetase
VIVPIPPKKNDVEASQLLDSAVASLVASLKAAGVRVKLDSRDHVRSGAKYFEWERKGVPLRIEIGPRDVRNQACVLAFRHHTGVKQSVGLDVAVHEVVQGLATMQQELWQAASDRLLRGITTQNVTYQEIKAALEADEASVYPGRGLFLVPRKCYVDHEAQIKQDCKATIRCYPLEENQAGLFRGRKCFYSGEDATHMALFGRAF